jgi:hypothetical protein
MAATTMKQEIGNRYGRWLVLAEAEGRRNFTQPHPTR